VAALAIMPLRHRLILFADIEKTEFAEVIELWQDAFEWSYYDSVLKEHIDGKTAISPPARAVESGRQAHSPC
jgi:hypothetical protein